MSKSLFDNCEADEVAGKENHRKQSISNKNKIDTSISTVEIKQQEIESNKPNLWLYLLACGYIRKYFTTRIINPNDIGLIVGKFLCEDWKFDYCYDYLNLGLHSKTHGIENNGKTIKCYSNHLCACFYCSFSFGMKPNSGKYKIKFKINQIEGYYFANIIGIISEK